MQSVKNFTKVEQIDNEIAQLQQQLKKVKGTRTEVYTRIVGYHRAVDNWNNGKKEEYKSRRTFNVGLNTLNEYSELKKYVSEPKEEPVKNIKQSKKLDTQKIAFYKLFTSEYCRNCPPVKEYMKEIPIVGEEVDVTTDLGINASRKYDILSTPTVVLFDDEDNIIEKVYTVDELKKMLK